MLLSTLSAACSRLFLALALNATAFAAPTLNDRYLTGESINFRGYELYPTSYLRHPVKPIEDELTLDKFVALLRARNVTTVEGAIALLPEYMRNDNYVVMYRSRSLQGATPREPRVILYTPTARFIVTFNGGREKGGNALELMQFHDLGERRTERRWEMRELTFAPGREPQLSGANPPKCLACHQSRDRAGADPRPNWEPYNIWPGAIGSNGGSIRRLVDDYTFKREIMKAQDQDFVAEQAREQEIADEFVRIAPAHPRYQLLGSLNVHAPTDLTDFLGVLNFERITRLMEETGPLYAQHKEHVALIARCGQFDNAGLVKLLEQYQARSAEPALPRDKVSGQILTLFNGLGVNTADWGMDFGTNGRFAAFEKLGMPSNPAAAFSWAYRVFARDAGALESASCADLLAAAQAKSAAFLAGPNAPPVGGRPAPAPEAVLRSTLQRCDRCHGAGGDGLAPSINFMDPAALRAQLGQGATLSRERLREALLRRTGAFASNLEQMPPNQPLTPLERETLQQYIESLTP